MNLGSTFAADLSDANRSQLLLDAITDYAIYMIDLDGTITSWNPGAERFKQYLATEILGENFSRFYPEIDREKGLPQRALKKAAEEGRFEGEGWRVRKDGSQFWAHVIIDPIRNPEGNLIGFAKITRDLTEREENRRKLDEAKAQLFQSQKLEAIGKLTGGVAHDFNNLLTVILSSLELLKRRGPLDERALKLIENASLAAQRGSALTQRMLAFARRQELELQSINIGDHVAAMIDLLSRSLGPSIDLKTSFPAELPPVRTDPNQLESAILNLVINSRDAMPEGGTIEISARELELPMADITDSPLAQFVAITVSDTGHGMDANTLALATDPFFTTKGVGKGTGLGLSMVQGLAEQSGGKLIMSSSEGRGTTAELVLPTASTRPATLLPDIPDVGAQSLRILAVDDDSLVLFNTSAMLEDLGHSVLEASSGKEALGILERERVDLIITDQAMPQMTGSQLAEKILLKWPNSRILMATGYAQIAPGIDLDLPKIGKPFLQNDLQRAIDQLFK